MDCPLHGLPLILNVTLQKVIVMPLLPTSFLLLVVIPIATRSDALFSSRAQDSNARLGDFASAQAREDTATQPDLFAENSCARGRQPIMGPFGKIRSLVAEVVDCNNSIPFLLAVACHNLVGPQCRNKMQRENGTAIHGKQETEGLMAE